MAKRKLKQLTHINRKITAGLGFLVILVLILWLGFNLFPSFSSPDNLKLAVLKNLKNPVIHLNLVNQLLKSYQINEAENATLYALQLSPADKNLKEKLEEIKGIKGMPNELKKEIKKWEKIVGEKPDYRDAYFQLAILNYQLYNNTSAKKNLEKVLTLDPNFSSGLALLEIINK